MQTGGRNAGLDPEEWQWAMSANVASPSSVLISKAPIGGKVCLIGYVIPGLKSPVFESLVTIEQSGS